MNRHFAIALVLALCAAGNVLAHDIAIEPPFTASRSRAEVLAELQQFRQSGADPWSQSYDQVAQMRGERTRAEARRDFIAARAAMAAMHCEDSGSTYLVRYRADEAAPRFAVLAAAD